MAKKIVDKVVAKGIVKRKSEDEDDVEIKQDFLVDDLGKIYWEKISEVFFQNLKIKEGYEFEIVLKTKKLDKKDEDENKDKDNNKIVQLTYQYIFKVILHLLNTV